MTLKQKERETIMDLQTQEKACIEKYEKYAEQAHDPVLRELFLTLKTNEQTHFQTLGKILEGTVPSCDCNDSSGMEYQPKATYSAGAESEKKKADCFLATDCITTEKMISSEYNTDVFNFEDSRIRKILADIQIEEQNHADMLRKYKLVNGMAA